MFIMVSSQILKQLCHTTIKPGKVQTYFGVIALRVAFFMRWERELDDGVLLICWSGVVTGPNILARVQRKHVVIEYHHQTGDVLEIVSFVKCLDVKFILF